jgi:hypothetical protein
MNLHFFPLQNFTSNNIPIYTTKERKMRGLHFPTLIIYYLIQNCRQYMPFKTSKLCTHATENMEYRCCLHWIAEKAIFFSTFPATMANPHRPSKLFAFSKFVSCNYGSSYYAISPTSLYLLGNWVSYKKVTQVGILKREKKRNGMDIF